MPAKRKPLESTLVNKLLPILNALPRAKAIKRHGSAFTRAGEPDIDCCIAGRSVQIECKREGEVSTPIQLRRQEEWRQAGALVIADAAFVWDVASCLIAEKMVTLDEWKRAEDLAKEMERRRKG